MFKLTEFEKWCEDIRKIIFDINVSIDNIRRITHPNDDFEKEVIKHGFFYHFYQQSRFVIIVQLCKLFSDNENQRINIHKLFNRLTTDKYDGQFEEKLLNNASEKHLLKNRTEIIKKIDELKTELVTYNNIIKKVTDLRNKVYAHSDPASTVNQVTNEELDILIQFAIKVYDTIHGRIFDVMFLFKHNKDWRVDYPLIVLAQNRKVQAEQLGKIKNK